MAIHMAESTPRLWPNLYILGNPKSGSTFFFSCLRAGPFDPNLIHGTDATAWPRDGSYLLTTLGTKKEFNYWGGPGSRWGWEWYLGAPAPITAWEWTGGTIAEDGRRRRRGENGNGEPSPFVERMCRLGDGNVSSPPLALAVRRREKKRAQRAPRACQRFPLECLEGKPIVRPGCALVRPFPSRRRCGRVGQPACESPRVRMSHAWPLASEASAAARTLDPSINTFMSYPAAPGQLFPQAASSSALRFIVILREPLARAASSARMMHEWKWEKAANISHALLSDLFRLGRCCDSIAPASKAAVALDGSSGLETTGSPWRRAAAELPRASDRSLRRFRDCLARTHPLNHVRASIYAAGVLGWLSSGFVRRARTYTCVCMHVHVCMHMCACGGSRLASYAGRSPSASLPISRGSLPHPPQTPAASSPAAAGRVAVPVARDRGDARHGGGAASHHLWPLCRPAHGASCQAACGCARLLRGTKAGA